MAEEVSVPSMTEVSKWEPAHVSSYIVKRFPSVCDEIEPVIHENRIFGISFLKLELGDWLKLGFVVGIAAGIVALRDQIKQQQAFTDSAGVNSAGANSVGAGSFSVSNSKAGPSIDVSGTSISLLGRRNNQKPNTLEQFRQMSSTKIPEAHVVFNILSRGSDKNGRLALKKTGHHAQWITMMENHRVIRAATLNEFPNFTLPEFKRNPVNKKRIKRRDKLVHLLTSDGSLKQICWPSVAYSVPEKFVRDTINSLISGAKRRLRLRENKFPRNYEEDDNVSLVATSLALDKTDLSFFNKLLYAGYQRPSYFYDKEFVIGAAEVKDRKNDSVFYNTLTIKILSLGVNKANVYFPFEKEHICAERKIEGLSIGDELSWPECMTRSTLDKRLAFVEDDESDSDVEKESAKESISTRNMRKRQSDGSINSEWAAKHVLTEENNYRQNQFVSLMTDGIAMGVGKIHRVDVEGFIHGIPIGEGNVSLNVHVVDEGCEELALPYPPTDEVITFGDLGKDMKAWYIRWPIDRLSPLTESKALKIIHDSSMQVIDGQMLKDFATLEPAVHKTVCLVALRKDKVDDVTAFEILNFCSKCKPENSNAFFALAKSKTKGPELYKQFAIACVKTKVVEVTKEGWKMRTFDRTTLKLFCS